VEEIKFQKRFALAVLAVVLVIVGCSCAGTLPTYTSHSTIIIEPTQAPTPTPEILMPSDDRWGIYALDLTTQGVQLLYSSPTKLSKLRLNSAGDRFVFSRMVGGSSYEHAEIFTVGIGGQDLQRLTDNTFWDLYPAWAPDGSRIAFLSWRDADLDIYSMNADGSDQALLYDSGFHDADIHWVGDQIVFTSGSRIWIMQDDGTGVRQLTDPPQAGEWGNANLPFGDYDPRISPDGARVLFTRLVDDESPHGNYDFYIVDVAGSDLTRLTETGHTQGLDSWSRAGDRIVFIVAAVDDVGQYDIHIMNADGSGVHNVTPDAFPPGFLCHSAIFSRDDTTIYFLGEWWSEE